jgi:hypothetical protein
MDLLIIPLQSLVITITYNNTINDCLGLAPLWSLSILICTTTDCILVCLLLIWTQSSELLYAWRHTANQFVLATSPLRPTTRILIFQLNTCGYSPYVTSSLTRGWVCSLQLLLGLASEVLLRCESHGTHEHILLSQIRDFPNMEGQVPVFISPRNRMVQLYPQALGSLFSPPTTRRATVEVFDPASTRDSDLNSILFSSYIAYPYPRKCLLITSIHGNVFHNELVSKNPSPRKRVYQRIP